MAWQDNLQAAIMGSPGGFKQSSRYSQPQQKIIADAGQAAQTYNMQQAPSFEPIRQESYRRFNQEYAPGLAERLTGLGNEESGNAYNQELARQRTNLESGLAGQEADYNLRRYGVEQNRLANLYNVGLTPMYDNTWQDGNQGFAVPFGQQVAQATGAGHGNWIDWITQGALTGFGTGGPAGAAIGAGIGAAGGIGKYLYDKYVGGGNPSTAPQTFTPQPNPDQGNTLPQFNPGSWEQNIKDDSFRRK